MDIKILDKIRDILNTTNQNITTRMGQIKIKVGVRIRQDAIWEFSRIEIIGSNVFGIGWMCYFC